MSVHRLTSQAAALRDLHVPGVPLVLTNVYDIPTARLVAGNPRTKAVATASYAIAGISGVHDDDLTLEQNLASIAKIVPAVHAINPNLPVTADMQDGYGDRLEEAVEKLIGLGVVGCNIEDAAREKGVGKLYSVDEACGRIRKLVETAKKLGLDNLVVNARTDTLVVGGSVEDTVKRAEAYLAAGATTCFVWGGPKRGMSREEVKTISDAVGGRINVKLDMGKQGLTVGDLAKIGVARISLGPELYRKAMSACEEAVNEVYAIGV